jgi:hypothetical protein
MGSARHLAENARFGEKRIALLRRLRSLAKAYWAMDISPRLMPGSFGVALLPSCGTHRLARGLIAIDGKTSRQTRGKGKAALRPAFAFAGGQPLVIG